MPPPPSSSTIARLMNAKDLLDAGKAEQAAAMLLPLAARSPRDANVASLTSITLYRLRRYEQAAFYANRAVGLDSGDPAMLTNLALVQAALAKHDQALGSLERAIAIDPGYPDARLSLANIALEHYRTEEAVVHCEAVLAKRWHAQVCITYCGALLAMGEVEKAVEMTRDALARQPEDASLWGGLCAGLNYMHGASVEESAHAHREFGRILAKYRPPETFTFRGTRDPTRTLKVGFVSNDLRTHSVSFFIEPFFELHDRERFEVHVFSTTRHPDATTARLRSRVPRWHECQDLVDVEMARLAEREGIDILVDLAGHTLNSQLTLFAYRPAPVQATYCGYPNTTGLAAIDYRVVDSLTDPARDRREGAALLPDHPDFDERCTEKLVRLDPCFLCYQPPADAPAPVRQTPTDPVTFGSFNANKKIGRGVIALWARVLAGVPGSRLLMKTFELKDPAARGRVLREFSACGIGPERIEIMDPTKGIAEHLGKYGLVDVALDTLPYNGTTTTCEALWMGVPVVALAGNTHAGRVGVSLLSAVGVPELIAPGEEAYVRLAVELAQDGDRLAEYRATLRDRVAQSCLCDRPGFCQRFSAALRDMWVSFVGAS